MLTRTYTADWSMETEEDTRTLITVQRRTRSVDTHHVSSERCSALRSTALAGESGRPGRRVSPSRTPWALRRRAAAAGGWAQEREGPARRSPPRPPAPRARWQMRCKNRHVL